MRADEPQPEDLLSTQNLLRKAEVGDERAIQRLYERYIHRVESWTRGRIPSRARSLFDTGTLAHEVLVKSLLAAAESEGRIREHFRAYVRRSVRNRLIDLGQGRQWQIRELDEALAQESPTELELILEREFEGQIGLAIARLPALQRELLSLRFERELSYAELARELGLNSEDAARMRVKRVLERVREELAAA